MARWDAGHTLWQRDKELWLFPLALEPCSARCAFLASACAGGTAQ
ncbi:hypothetical protein [Klebsiella pneumoniae]